MGSRNITKPSIGRTNSRVLYADRNSDFYLNWIGIKRKSMGKIEMLHNNPSKLSLNHPFSNPNQFSGSVMVLVMAFSSIDVVVETVPSRRYKRYDTIIRNDDKKKVYKGLDSANGEEIAWSKVDILVEMFSNKNLLVSCFTVLIAESFPFGNIREYVRKCDVTDINAIKSWCTQIFKGLDHCHIHDLKIIHRILNCDNIFVDGRSIIVKIGELGLALIFEQGDTTVQSFSCRPEFMAPELLEGYYYNELIDIYSFGMCVLQMVTRETPYSVCRTKQHILGRVGSRKMLDALSKVTDSEVKKFMEKCLSTASDRSTANERLNDQFLQPSVSSSVAASSSLRMNEPVGDQPGRLQVQPMPFRTRGKSTDIGPFEMTLFIAGEEPIKFGFPVNDTTQEFMKKEGFSASMFDAELSLVSELMEKLKTGLSSLYDSQMKLFLMTIEKHELRMNEPVGDQPVRLQVQPRPSGIRGISSDTGPFEMTVFIAGEEPVKFGFTVNDTTQEVMEKEGLSESMSDAELSLVSELLEKLKTELSSSYDSQMKFLQITSEKRQVSPIFRVTTEQQSEVADMQID